MRQPSSKSNVITSRTFTIDLANCATPTSAVDPFRMRDGGIVVGMSGDVNTVAQDTSEDVERRQIEGWRRMSPDEKAGIIAGLTQTVYELAMAGIRARHPNATP